MRIIMDFEQISDYVLDINNLNEDIESYVNDIQEKIETISDITDGKFSKTIIEEFERRRKHIDIILEHNQELSDKLENFIEGYKDIDANETMGEYSMDIEEIKKNKKRIEKFTEDMKYERKDIEFEAFLDEYDIKVRTYKNVKMTNRKIRNEYEDDEHTAEYLINRKDEIEEQMNNKKKNMNIIDEINDLLKKD